MPERQWLKVEFYGLLPDGGALREIDPLSIGSKLAHLFGFEVVGDLSVLMMATQAIGLADGGTLPDPDEVVCPSCGTNPDHKVAWSADGRVACAKAGSPHDPVVA